MAERRFRVDEDAEIGSSKLIEGKKWILKDINTYGSGDDERTFGTYKKQGAFSATAEKIDKRMDKILSDPKDLTKLLMSLNVITESSRMTPLSSGRVKTPIGQITTGITKGLIQGKQIETAETAALAKYYKSRQKPTKFVKTGFDVADETWLKDYMLSYDNSKKRATQVNLRYNLIFGVKDNLPTGAVENIISPIRKLAAGFFGDEGDALDSFNNTLDKFVSGDISGLNNTQIVKFQDQFKAITMEQVIQDAKNLYPVSEADVKRLLDAAGDIGTYSGALKNLVSIQKAVSVSNQLFHDGIYEYGKLSGGATFGDEVVGRGLDGTIIISNNMKDFAEKYANSAMNKMVKDALGSDENIAKLYKKHQLVTGEKENVNKLTSFDKLFAVYAINLQDKNILNFQAIDQRTQEAVYVEDAEKWKTSLEDLQKQIQEDKKKKSE